MHRRLKTIIRRGTCWNASSSRLPDDSRGPQNAEQSDDQSADLVEAVSGVAVAPEESGSGNQQPTDDEFAFNCAAAQHEKADCGHQNSSENMHSQKVALSSALIVT